MVRALIYFVGVWTLLSLGLCAAILAIRSLCQKAESIRSARRRRRCASGQHDRTTVVEVESVVLHAYPVVRREVLGILLYEKCLDCDDLEYLGPVRASAECHATVKRRDAA